MTNLKAVIPVAGLGMHMLPATKAICNFAWIYIKCEFYVGEI